MANLLTNPENFGAVWTTLSQGVVNVNQAVAPDGTMTADELVDDGSTGSGSAGINQSGVTVSASTQYVLSLFAQKNGDDWCGHLPANYTDPANAWSYFNISAGAVGTLDAEHDASGIIQYADGWWRPYLVFTTSGDTGGAIRFYVCEQDGTVTLTSLDGSHSIYIWGAVLEEGNYPTDYTSVGGTTVFPVS